MRRGVRAVVQERIRGSTAELRAQQGGGVWWTAVQCIPGRLAQRERRASALQGERAGQGGRNCAGVVGFRREAHCGRYPTSGQR